MYIAKASGPDQVSSMKQLSPLLQYWKLFLHTLWILAYKKGDSTQPSNYRPISLTSIVSQIFEYILSSHITKHLKMNNILHQQQHGFRCNCSCETQLISLFQDLSLKYDNDTQTNLISLDFAKAFHIRGCYTNFNGMVSREEHTNGCQFLLNRSQQVVLNGICSSSIPVSSGVPQGTVLGLYHFFYT